ncbi:MAG: DegT/DnrJ/EryC1/StrS family aminotransferase [Chloroflexi bacterium]|nr:DegT/DnrJ/EryC1/StrS family aminotransferase [Chloroflexota bacterium]
MSAVPDTSPSSEDRRPSPAIPFVDLRAQHDELRPEIEAAIRDIVDRSSFIGGPYVEGFEREFAAYCGAAHAIGCASGTDALKLALLATGVEPDDEVITVPFTFIATVEAVTQVGAHPVFVDVDPTTYTLDPNRLAEFLEVRCRRVDGRTIDARTGRRVTAIIPVHLYGFPCDMSSILALAARYQLQVVEDACQAHGAMGRLTSPPGPLSDTERGDDAGSVGAGPRACPPSPCRGGGKGGEVDCSLL